MKLDEFLEMLDFDEFELEKLERFDNKDYPLSLEYETELFFLNPKKDIVD